MPSSLTGPLRIFFALAILCALPLGCGDDSGSDAPRGPRLEVLVDDNRGDGRQALDAPLQARRLAIDADGSLLLTEYDRVRRVDARTGVIGTVEGTVLSRCDGELPGFPCLIRTLAADREGGIYVATNDGRILQVDAAGGAVTHVAGKAVSECEGPPSRLVGPALDVCLPSIVDMAVDGAGNLYLASGDFVLRFDPASADVVVAAGDGSAGPCVDGVPALATCLDQPSSIAVDRAGALYMTSAGSSVRRVDPTTSIITSVVGRAHPCEPSPGENGGPAGDACLIVEDVAVDDAGNLYVTDRLGWTIRRVDAQTGRIEALDAPGLEILAIAVGPDQRVVAVRQTENGFATVAVRYGQVAGPGTIVAGNRTPDVCGDGGPARDACLGIVTDLAVGGDATFVADTYAMTVRRIDRRGIITRIAGNGRGGLLDYESPPCDDALAATDTCVEPPLEIAADRDGRVYLLEGDLYPPDVLYNRVRRVDAMGRIETVVGGCRMSGSIYEVPARDACLGVHAIAVDPRGDLYVAERARISRLDPASGFLVPVVEEASRCDLFSRQEPECFEVLTFAVDAEGNVYITDFSRLRRFDAASGGLAFIDGNGNGGTCGDGGPAIDACLSPTRVAVAADGDVFVQTNGAIRRIDAATGLIATVAGQADEACAYDGRSGCLSDLALDADGRVLFTESSRRLMRLTLPEG